MTELQDQLNHVERLEIRVRHLEFLASELAISLKRHVPYAKVDELLGTYNLKI